MKSAKPSAKPQRDYYHHGDLRQSLVDAAIALIQEGEIAQLSLREVARQVGVSHNAPYRHFKDKEALISAVAEQGFQGLRQATEQALEGLSSDAAQRLTAIGCAYVKFAAHNPAYYRVMFSLCGSCQDEGLKIASTQSFAVLLKVIQDGQAITTFRTDDSLHMAQVAWAFVHGIAMLAIDGRLPIAGAQFLDDFVQSSLKMLLEGFLRASAE